jgi:integrase/recombinase XerC
MKSVAKERRERNILTSEELKSLNDWVYRNDDPGRIELRHRVLFELLVSCAPRSADIISLTWSRIDFETSTITIKESKTAKVRTLGMTGALKRALQAWRPECSSEYVMSVYGTKAHRYSLTKSIRSWFKAIGSARVKEGYIGSHLFRHTLATRAFIKTRDLETARELLGHTSLLTTLQYIHLPPAELGTLKEELSEDFRKEEND